MNFRFVRPALGSLLLALTGCVFDPGESKGPARPASDVTTSAPAAPQAKRDTASETTSAAVYERLAVPAHALIAFDYAAIPTPVVDRENYAHFVDNPVFVTAETPVSTFSIDVDTAAYANMRRFLNQGHLPNPDAIRTEELVNYFDYDYPSPRDAEQPFTVHTEIGPSPWHPGRQLLHIGVKGFERAHDALPVANLVFLIDVSGSMAAPDKLELLKSALKLLVPQLRAQDRVAIAVYAGASGIVLEPTPGDQKARIIAALDRLEAGGSTNGSAGIELAYQLARQSFVESGINRVILATDGDFNVGLVDHDALTHRIERERDSGVSLSILGFGSGDYNDALMQSLAQSGNGNAAYIDTLNEGRKVLVDELASTLETIAQDVKIQVEFNPQRVAEYRLVGYESRALAREDFKNDRVDAGDIGAGHTVTALYELTPAGSDDTQIDPLRYGGTVSTRDASSSEVAFVRLRYKRPGESTSREIERPIAASSAIDDLARTSRDFRFSAAVAAFGQILRGGRYTGDFAYDDVLALARAARGDDADGHRGEFLGLVRTAAALSMGTQVSSN
jgi:Ca-activated chloride channel family protein